MDVSSVVIKGMEQAAIIPSVIWQTNDSVAVPAKKYASSPLPDRRNVTRSALLASIKGMQLHGAFIASLYM